MGIPKAEIIATREKAAAVLKSQGWRVINTLFADAGAGGMTMRATSATRAALCNLARSLERMSLCHAVYFCRGWEQARGCKIEHEAAKAYGLEIIYEEAEETETPDSSVASKIAIEYEDGTTRALDKGLVLYFSDREDDIVHVLVEMVSLSGEDLHDTVEAANELMKLLALYESTEGIDDEV